MNDKLNELIAWMQNQKETYERWLRGSLASGKTNSALLEEGKAQGIEMWTIRAVALRDKP